MNLIPVAKDYFLNFSNKDIESLKKQFSKNIILRDWEIDVSGYDNVVSQNIEIFDNLGNFSLNIIELNQSENIVYAEIEITLENSEKIIVLDKIIFDSSDKIQAITAFKG